MLHPHYLFGSTITESPIFISLKTVSEREQTNLRMSLFLVILFLITLTLSTPSESIHVKNLPSAVVVGTVFCDTCSKQEFSYATHFISGASVGVECKDGNSKLRFKKEVKTDENGEFKVQLPFSVRKHVKRIKGCTLKLISSSEPDCAVASEAASYSSSLRIKSRSQAEHIFSAGLFSFKPSKRPNHNNLCSQKPSVQNSKESVFVKNKFPPNIDPSFPPPLHDPPTPSILPPLPLLPPLTPLLPPLPEIPFPPPIIQGKTKEQEDPNPHKESLFSDKKEASHPEFFFFPPLVPNPFQPPPLIPNPLQPPPLIPNPFQPPPSLPNPFRPPSPPLLPNPFQPPSPPPLLPNPFQPPPSPPPFLPNPFQPPPSPPPFLPNPFQPPPSPTPTPTPLFPFPPIPGLTPSPPPPPPPAPVFPFPPLFPPLFPPPRSPGSPPSSPLKNISP